MYDDDIQTGITASFANRSFYKVAKFPTRNITAPIVLVYGGSDSLVDIEVMLKELPSHTVATGIDHFEHLDFLWGQDVEKIVFPRVLEALAKFSADPEVELSLTTAGDRAVASQEEKVTETLKQEPLMVEPTGRKEVAQLAADVLPPTYSEDEAEVEPPTAAAVVVTPHPELEGTASDAESEPKLELEPEPEYEVVPEPAVVQLVDDGPAPESAPRLASVPISEPALEQAPKTPVLEPALEEQAPKTPVLESALEHAPKTPVLEPALEHAPKTPVLEPALEQALKRSEEHTSELQSRP